ncbi:PTS sugar transporter subunit IIA [Sphingomonas bacterium]|uniref:PTS sugar transporter subunit IIA n=1 Tax=Sphingomonas bacterium TaxID=1895847 RepID=UPI00157582AC|nr:PTS sugar transporter subunit IIA [Sphingomonas bacterium]
MTDLSDLLRPEAVLTGVAAATKKAVLASVAAAAAGIVDGDARDIGERLAAREKLGSTGFGYGVALPHARLPGLAVVTGVFVRLAQPIDFGAVDDLPVDLVFALLSPVEAGADHLKALARVSRQLRDRAFLAKLRGAASCDALYALLCEDQARDAA